MPTPRRDGRKRREALLDAALEVFLDKGLLSAGIEDIRKAARASPSSVYHHFPEGRAEVVLGLLARIFDELFAHLSARVAAAEGARGAVLALVDGHLEWVFAHPREASFMYQAMSVELSPAQRDQLAALKAEQMIPLVARFGAHIARGELPALSPAAVDVVVLGVSHEACRRWLMGADLDPDWMRSSFPEMAWAAVQGAARGL